MLTADELLFTIDLCREALVGCAEPGDLARLAVIERLIRRQSPDALQALSRVESRVTRILPPLPDDGTSDVSHSLGSAF